MNVKIYTDGACINNPGPGGWAAIIIDENKKKELSGHEDLTTNNRMELTAAIKGLEYCEDQKKEGVSFQKIEIYTDSVYVKDGITIWINDWKKNNWKKSDKKKVKNIDLWKKLSKLTKLKQIKWIWVKGHSNNLLNDLADKLAKKAAYI